MNTNDVVIVGDTIRCPELRHEVPVAIIDPIVYVERDGKRYAFAPTMDAELLYHLEDLQVVPFEDLGSFGPNTPGSARGVILDVAARACARLGVDTAVVPWTFPLEVASALAEAGVHVRPDRRFFDERRRVKTPQELAGIRRALKATEAGFEAVRDRLSKPGPVSSEDLRAAVVAAYQTSGVRAHDVVIVSHGPQTAVAHHPGEGPIAPGEPVIADLICSDPASGCWADVTRTFCLGEPPAELVEYQRVCREALRLGIEAIRPGVTSQHPNDVVSEFFEQAGFATRRRRKPGDPLTGFFHGLGHGVGLEVHEAPSLMQGDETPLRVGEVLCVEPGLYRPEFGGCRLEDMVVVTADGCEVLGPDSSYEL